MWCVVSRLCERGPSSQAVASALCDHVLLCDHDGTMHKPTKLLGYLNIRLYDALAKTPLGVKETLFRHTTYLRVYVRGEGCRMASST